MLRCRLAHKLDICTTIERDVQMVRSRKIGACNFEGGGYKRDRVSWIEC